MKNQNEIYEPIRRKIEEWLRYDANEPKGKYFDHVAEYDEYRRWHDRDCVLTGGNLKADTMFSLWTPLKHTISRVNDAEAIRKVGNISSKYAFIKELIKDDNLEKLLPIHMPITAKLSVLFELGMGRENVFLLPDRQLNPQRARKPYDDYVPAFLLASFPGGKFAHYWGSPKEYLEWIEREHFQVFFDGDIAPENIRDLSGSGNAGNPIAPKGVEAMERMLDNYIGILRERRNYFTEAELNCAAELDEMLRTDEKVQEFRARVNRGDKEALALMEELLGDIHNGNINLE